MNASRRLYLIALIGLAAVATIASYVIYRMLFPLGSGDLDEGVYVFQANMLLHGLVSLPAHRYGEFFRPWLTGESGGRIFTEFQLGLPAFLALSQLLFGSMRVGLALVAGGTVFATYGFTFELLRDRRVAITASAFLAFSPIFMIHSALILTYPLTLFGVMAAGWGVLRGCRTARRRDLLLGGLALGLVLLTRPFDALLFGAPLLGLAIFRLKGDRTWAAAAGLLAVPIAIGVAPFIAATLWYNWQATGSMLAFPNMAADPSNTFGFGTRTLMVGQPKLAYTARDAVSALRQNAVTIPSWLFGGPVMLALAAFGLFTRRKSVEAWALVVIGLAFPLGYLFWWATLLSGALAENGLGPQYYVPLFVPLAVFGAVGFTTLFERRSWPLGVAGVAVLIAVTGWAVPGKISTNRYVTEEFQREAHKVPSGLKDALVFVYQAKDNRYLLSEYPFLQTAPDLSGSVVYAAYRGASDASLMRELPGRRAYVLRPQYEPGNQLFSPTGGLIPVRAAAGTQLRVSVEPLEAPEGAYVRAYISDGIETRYISLRRGADGRYPTIGWTVAIGSGPPSGNPAVTLVPDGQGELTVGFETSASATFLQPTQRESRIAYATSTRSITVVTPGLGWSYVEYPKGGVWLPADVSSEMGVRVAPR